jgi:hypothetical protein
MAQHSRTIRTSATGAGVAAVELIAGIRPVKVREIGIILVNATASVFGLGRPAAKGITPTTPVSLLDLANGDPNANASKLAVAWGTGPTIPAAFFRQCSLAAVAGATLNPPWQFAKNSFVIPVGGTIILWTVTTVSIADIYFTVDE